MVWESYPWKQDLLRRKRLFLKYNTAEHFEKDEDATYTVLEKAVFYSAFIIRKLIDCTGKMSDEADHYTLKVEKVKTLKEPDVIHRWPKEDSHDWEHPQSETVNGKTVCNWLIHSYMFFFVYSEDDTVEGFYVSSDKDRNKALYHVCIQSWLEYVSFIADDYVVASDSHYDEKVGDYVYTKKERGRL